MLPGERTTVHDLLAGSSRRPGRTASGHRARFPQVAGPPEPKPRAGPARTRWAPGAGGGVTCVRFPPPLSTNPASRASAPGGQRRLQSRPASRALQAGAGKEPGTHPCALTPWNPPPEAPRLARRSSRPPGTDKSRAGPPVGSLAVLAGLGLRAHELGHPATVGGKPLRSFCRST